MDYEVRLKVVLYIMWSALIIGAGYKIWSNINDKSNPNSLINNFEKIDYGNPEIP